MRTFYHLDRRGAIQEGQTLSLRSYSINSPIRAIKDHAQSLFIDGVTPHGNMYINSRGIPDNYSEWFFEYVRRCNFNDRPSRFQSFFSFLSLEELQRFKQKLNINKGTIYVVECQNYFKADMNLLGMPDSPLTMSWLANTYWSGESIKEPKIEPLWECLLTGPVKIIKKI
ncbi:hypothetical protein CVD25_01150 [Bacillus canaveralius]|uniref:DUF2441 domain-containing protein n=1 Tax=Bacillus canaveralius TaxID=1403243 RepID=A0A2N5GPN5_9BACI|nr:hypothetical protein [Bacillus canaveralius]PLR84671.1 hypothetical protein CU635_06260 [Bacillus canaveralius]PLS00823.1 hypothetical protein CVD25_01150 [Bacillus canaveralius]